LSTLRIKKLQWYYRLGHVLQARYQEKFPEPSELATPALLHAQYSSIFEDHKVDKPLNEWFKATRVYQVYQILSPRQMAATKFLDPQDLADLTYEEFINLQIQLSEFQESKPSSNIDPFIFREKEIEELKILDSFVEEIIGEIFNQDSKSRDDFGQERKNEVW
jgi:hypothetical protein